MYTCRYIYIVKTKHQRGGKDKHKTRKHFRVARILG